MVPNISFQALQDLLKEEASVMVDNWNGIKEALTPTCRAVPDRNRHHHKELISVETLDMVREKRNKKATNNNS
ncbi:unnamed protein product [Schistosoma curassoni]|uniref:CACTA en-spm transposon protein n=1 Tax=Schistosoma curassoni TaxID=6186 RepID=A0A183K4E1_9TREM|nr:unnamed protein product [Schistosoma curassoni]